MTGASVLVAALALLGPSLLSRVESTSLPAQAQVIDQKSFNVLNTTQPPSEFNADNVRDQTCNDLWFLDLTDTLNRSSCLRDTLKKALPSVHSIFTTRSS